MVFVVDVRFFLASKKDRQKMVQGCSFGCNSEEARKTPIRNMFCRSRRAYEVYALIFDIPRIGAELEFSQIADSHLRFLASGSHLN